MKPITEEQRQELLEWIPEHIEWVSDDVKKSSYARKVTLAIEIALASLTAEPEAHSYRYAGCETWDGFKDWRDELSSEKPPEWMIDTGKVTDLQSLYNAPPVPVIKLPEELDEHWEDDNYDDIYVSEAAGYNRCLLEIKRLNNLE